jgi:predicted ATPase/DNA-binding SARP family transcriptional activator
MANLTLGLLGSLQVMVANAPPATFESDKARALLAYLVVESGQPHRRESLLGLLWPDCSEDIARRNLRQTLYTLRQAIGDHTAKPPYLLISREEIQFNRASDHSLDVAEFQSLLSACDAHVHPRPEACGKCAGRREKAVRLYRGKFLGQFFLQDSAEFEEWALVQRESLHRRALEALAHLAQYHERCGDYEAARRFGLRQLELDPWREEAHRQVMRALALSGQRSEALVQYETCRRLLVKELGVEPSAETRELYEEISRGGRPAKRQASFADSPTTVRSFPVPLTPFVGRERELADLNRLLADPQCRLVTLVGPGGVGKTRLALHAASDHREKFAEGVAFIPLTPVGSTGLIVPAIAEALDLSFHSASDPKQQLLDGLREKQMLLVLDNFEHLLDGAGLCVEILQCASEVKLLVTSREPLNLLGEWVYEVAGLAFPGPEAIEGFEDYSAVSLFLERACRARVGFELREEERRAIARICRSVEGLPLALELAAAWVRTLSCAEIALQIDRDLDFLTVARRDLPERHRSLRAVFDHSWSMLTLEEQSVLSKLCVFRGGFEREAAERVASASLSALAALVAKSLVRRVEGNRYSLHELVRQYAQERLVESGELDATCGEHLGFFLDLAEKAEHKLVGFEQRAWSDRLEQDQDNLRAALEWSLRRGEVKDELSDQPEEQAVQESLRLAGALFMFWKRRDHWSEGREWLQRALIQSAGFPGSKERAQALNGAVILAVEQADVGPATALSAENLALSRSLGDRHSLASALNAHGYLLWKQKDFAAARAYCEEGLILFRELSDRFGTAESLHVLGHIATNQDDYEAADSYLAESVSIYREIGDHLGLHFSYGDLGLVAYLRNDFVAAQSRFEESLAGARRIGSIPGMVASLNGLGDLARYRGDYEQAERLYSECLSLYRHMGDKDEIPSLLHNLAYVAQHRGNCSNALAWFREALTIQQEMRNRAGIAECLAGIAGVLSVQGETKRGARLLSAAESLRKAAGARLWPANQIEFRTHLDLLRRSLDEAALGAAWAEGRVMTTERAIGDALGGLIPTSAR